VLKLFYLGRAVTALPIVKCYGDVERGEAIAIRRLAPPCPFHLPSPSYCDVIQARRYFAPSLIRFAELHTCLLCLCNLQKWTGLVRLHYLRPSLTARRPGMTNKASFTGACANSSLARTTLFWIRHTHNENS
jgi:hypothetical protein